MSRRIVFETNEGLDLEEMKKRAERKEGYKKENDKVVLADQWH
jgi:hypothetical protein